ncbi:GNAT family N-acetyltransferase [Georgenia subflava]|uniref:GNAT family N-acetyltransferase n=1 Tax=Georgenia subflava TaxID=1622177 RepID=A0A6N7EQP8_9MICO|nr:GNAT family protein [Georgenia subflava]MPV37524.1 GNAT family N-acetyltransferase [Georgenia subflava]
MPAIAPDGRVLTNDVVTLRPLVLDDAAELFAVLDDERVWASGYGAGPSARPRDLAGARAFVAGNMRAGTGGVAYAVTMTGTGELVGTTTLGDVDLVNEGAHLGWTAYAPRVWGTSVNPAAKLALLGHAFEDCGLGRVKLQTDAVNARSQAAIAKLGAVREGVARHHRRRADGAWRDSVIFSILAEEWPAVRAGLQARLGTPEGGI